MIDEAVLTQLIEHLDFEPACESPLHYTGGEGHTLEQSASWIISYPCGIEWLYCDSWVREMNEFRYIICECGTDHPVPLIRAAPLSGDR